MRKEYKVINLLSGLITIIDARTSRRAMRKGREYFGTSQVIVIQFTIGSMLPIKNAQSHTWLGGYYWCIVNWTILNSIRAEFSAFSARYN